MNCTTYQNLTPKEKTEFIGKLVHATQSSEYCYQLGQQLIKVGENQNVFEGVTINPAPPIPDKENNI